MLETRPNCEHCGGGGFAARPIRPARDWNGANFLGAAPASTVTVWRPVDLAAHDTFAKSIAGIPPEKR